MDQTASAPLIRQVFPVDFYELVVGFEDGDFRIYPADPYSSRPYSFMSFPNKLKAFVAFPDKIVWRNGAMLSGDFLHRNSRSLSEQELRNKLLTIGMKNQAPTPVHATHHVYGVSVYPLNAETPFYLGESIAGGHGEMGGGSRFSLKDLLEYPEWKKHFELSDCFWAIAVIESGRDHPEKIMHQLVREVCRRSSFD